MQNTTTPDFSPTGTGEITVRDSGPACAEEERQKRRTTHPGDAGKRQADPRRMLGLSLILQALRDLEATLYKDQTRSPQPTMWLFGATAREGEAMMDLKAACRLGRVPLSKVRARAESLIEGASGPLAERRFATAEELRQDKATWMAITALREEYGFTIGCVRGWCARGQVTAVKTSGQGGPFWHVRVDEQLQGRVERYWRQSTKGGPAPTIDPETDHIRNSR